MASPTNLLTKTDWSQSHGNNTVIQRLNLECRFTSLLSRKTLEKIPSSGSRLAQCALYKAVLQADREALQFLEENSDQLRTDIVIEKCCARHADIFERHPFVVTPLKEDHWSLISYMVRKGHCPCWPRRFCKVTASKSLVHTAAAQGQLWLLQYLLEQGCHLNCCSSPMRYTPLFLAITKKHKPVVDFLLSRGAEVNTKTHSGKTPLMAAISQGDADMVSTLLNSNQCDVNAMSHRGVTALKVAACCDNLECAKLLLEAGSGTHRPETKQQSPLFDAVQNVNVPMLDLLLSYKLDVNVRNNQSRTPLHCALEKGNLKLAEALLKAGANCNMKRNGLPLLMAYTHDPHVLKLLLKHGADVNKRDDKGYTTMHLIALCGYRQAMCLCLEYDADCDVSSLDGKTPLSLACQIGREDIVEALLTLGCDVNKTDDGGNCPLHYSALQGNEWIVEDLLNAGAKTNSTNHFGATPLWNAVYKNHPRTVKELVLADSPIECQSTGEHVSEHEDKPPYSVPRSLLWVAVDQSAWKVVKCLLDTGTSVHKESWILTGDFPESLQSFPALQKLLVKLASSPPTLLKACRTTIRRHIQETSADSMKSVVNEVFLPTVLKKFLTLGER